jgi:hypothetical protein
MFGDDCSILIEYGISLEDFQHLQVSILFISLHFIFFSKYAKAKGMFCFKRTTLVN